MINFKYERINSIVKKLDNLSNVHSEELNNFVCISTDYKGSKRPPMADETWQSIKFGDVFSELDKHFWLYGKIKTPQATNNHSKVYFEFSNTKANPWDAINPQTLVFINGKAVQGMDVNHTDLELEFDKEYDIHLYLYTGLEKGTFNFFPSIKIIDCDIEQLYYDLKVPLDAYNYLDETSDEAMTILKHLELACNILDLKVFGSEEFHTSVVKASEFLLEEFYKKVCGKSESIVSCIGHTHIDVAWKWTIAQTEEKAQRSFATMLNLINQYDDFIFMSSQPQLYKYVKENEPELYEKIKQRIKEGRWEAEGAMWLEADCNLCSGESLIRQILFGKKFFMDEFGIDSKILWLPDVFGYSAALPQILKKSGVDKFVTSKISWNDTNHLPYDVFMWEGLDGSEIFTTFLTACDYENTKYRKRKLSTYNAIINPAHVFGTRNIFQQKEYTNCNLLTFGYGDGGGGTTREMIENHRRLKYGLPGFPKTVIEKASDALDRIEKDFIKASQELKKIPKWCGELYLEFHRGTYTSMAKNKKNNRKSEFLFQTAEQLSSATSILCNALYPQDKINNSWETILLNQFHDIIPGSSIEEVYKDSDIQYAEVKKSGTEITENALNALSKGIRTSGKYVYNPNSFTVSGTVSAGGKTLWVTDVPAMGWKLAKYSEDNTITVTNKELENNFYRLTLNDDGNITAVYDKRFERNVTKPGFIANEIEVFEDIPYSYDNWEISPYYKQKKLDMPKATSVECINDGTRAGWRIKRNFLSSVIIQEIYVYEFSPRIDFETYLDWKESHILIKAAFPLDVHSDKATYETQFGYLERPAHENSPYDSAKFEVCAHKYADISEDDYGVAILNDCKYGYNTERNTLKLTLLKCGTDPNPNADKEEHRFTYSLLPHGGRHTTGRVVQESYILNRPLIVFEAEGSGNLPTEYSLVSCDKENIIAETFKLAENKDGYILRAYDAYNRKANAVFTFGFDVKSVHLCDMGENIIEELKVMDGNKVAVNFSNFEIVTLRIRK